MIKRPAIGSITACTLVTVWIMLAANRAFISKAQEYIGAESPAAFAYIFGFALILLVLFISLSVRYITKPILIFSICMAAVSSWFTDRFGVVIDRSMIHNTFESTFREAGQHLTPAFILHLFIFAVLPSCLLLIVHIKHRPWRQKAAYNSAAILPLIGVIAAIVLIFFQTFAATVSGHRDLPASFNPGAAIFNTIDYFVGEVQMENVAAQPLGMDAKKRAPAGQEQIPTVLVLVIGETARSQNFSLNGYGRETNPNLKSVGVTSFTDVTSCGTSTYVSLPCMFSVYGRKQYTQAKGRSTQHLLDVLQYAQFKTVWVNNNTGDKGLGQTSEYESVSHNTDAAFCTANACFDGILVKSLVKHLDGITEDTVIVLHMRGSHGPAYYRQYPSSYRKFMPDCRTDDITACSDEEIVNAYDNSILYTDQVLSHVVSVLNGPNFNVNSAMLFVSDHGESLGEGGLYLHGTPYLIAPEYQTKVPLIFWANPSFMKNQSLDQACITAKQSRPLSHDNLFHSILGMLGVQTSVLNVELDIFGDCRTAMQ